MTQVKYICIDGQVGVDGSTFDTWKEVVEITPSETHTGHRFGHQVVVNDAGVYSCSKF